MWAISSSDKMITNTVLITRQEGSLLANISSKAKAFQTSDVPDVSNVGFGLNYSIVICLYCFSANVELTD